MNELFSAILFLSNQATTKVFWPQKWNYDLATISLYVHIMYITYLVQYYTGIDIWTSWYFII